jgi:nucleoside-diphosphate-sugar epimerase
MRRVVVTGAAGFIGSHLCETLLARGDEVVGIDCFTDYYDPAVKRANLLRSRESGLRFVSADLAEAQLEPHLEGAAAVFHLAAQPGVRSSFGGDFKLYASRNLVATQRLLEAMVNAGTGRLVFASSSSVYGGTAGAESTEDATRAPISPYGLTKAACEDLVDVYRRTTGLSATALRYFTVYGPRQRPEMAFAAFITAILRGRSLTVFGDGSQSRDFTYVGDAVAATVAAAEDGVRRAYNVSGGARATVLEAIRLIERLTGRRALLHLQPAGRGDPLQTSADLRAARTDLGYWPTTSLEAGLTEQIAAAAPKRSLRRTA